MVILVTLTIFSDLMKILQKLGGVKKIQFPKPFHYCMNFSWVLYMYYCKAMTLWVYKHRAYDLISSMRKKLITYIAQSTVYNNSATRAIFIEINIKYKIEKKVHLTNLVVISWSGNCGTIFHLSCNVEIDAWYSKDKLVITILRKSNKVSINLVTTASSENCTRISTDRKWYRCTLTISRTRKFKCNTLPATCISRVDFSKVFCYSQVDAGETL